MKAEPYKNEAHSFDLRTAGKQVCSNCGLVALNNQFTAWAIRMGCRHKDHPSYSSKRYETTKLPF